MAKAAAWLVVAVYAVCIGGCGTVSNVIDTRQVFGGVNRDVKDCAANWEFWQEGGKGPPPMFGLLGAIICVADLPLSAVADTLTLPWTISAELSAWNRQSMPTNDQLKGPPSRVVESGNGRTMVISDPKLAQ